jgi:fructose-1,6-bisphosphatase-3
VDRLHVVGDVFDRGPHADVILDRLMCHHSVDIQWGNHDVLWMGAASGSGACIVGVLNISTKYGNIDFVENAYGINLRPLALFAQETYTDDTDVVDHMHKAIAIIQFKLEGEIIKRRSEYDMEDRLLLEKINYGDMTVELNGKVYPLTTGISPRLSPEDPYRLTPDGGEVVCAAHTFVYAQREAHATHKVPVLTRQPVQGVQRQPDVPRVHTHDKGRGVPRVQCRQKEHIR